MSDAIAFDTHRFVKNLTESGFTEKQAEALANEQIQLLNSNLATKVDIAAVRADVETVNAQVELVKAQVEMVKAQVEMVRADVEMVRADVEVVRADVEVVKAGLEAQIEESRADVLASQNNMLRWMITAMVALAGLIVAVVKLG